MSDRGSKELSPHALLGSHTFAMIKPPGDEASGQFHFARSRDIRNLTDAEAKPVAKDRESNGGAC